LLFFFIPEVAVAAHVDVVVVVEVTVAVIIDVATIFVNSTNVFFAIAAFILVRVVTIKCVNKRMLLMLLKILLS